MKADSSPIFGINPDPTYDGWYVEANWFLTGESQTYQKGVIGRPKVKNPVFKGGYGAWQLAGRYDVLDLTTKPSTSPPATCAASRRLG
ncbi:MAG: porin [Methyloceanibacter sp.]|uniref:porin n=1 Tax=Methyloceanibacter sp. TaxID=1965321 RepID=UPI003D9BAAE3